MDCLPETAQPQAEHSLGVGGDMEKDDGGAEEPLVLVVELSPIRGVRDEPPPRTQAIMLRLVEDGLGVAADDERPRRKLEVHVVEHVCEGPCAPKDERLPRRPLQRLGP